MTEKKQRFENRLDKNNIKFNTLNPVWDNWQGTALNVFEMIDVMNEQSDELVEYCNFSLHDLLDKKNKEIEELKKAFNDFIEYDDEDFRETKHINSIYKEEGFNGVIDYAKDKLQYYGVVKEVEKGLWVMVTGGWSDNEFFIHCLNNLLSDLGRQHYRAYEKGGAFYYTEEPRADVEISLKKEVKE